MTLSALRGWHTNCCLFCLKHRCSHAASRFAFNSAKRSVSPSKVGRGRVSQPGVPLDSREAAKRGKGPREDGGGPRIPEAVAGGRAARAQLGPLIITEVPTGVHSTPATAQRQSPMSAAPDGQGFSCFFLLLQAPASSWQTLEQRWGEVGEGIEEREREPTGPHTTPRWHQG